MAYSVNGKIKNEVLVCNHIMKKEKEFHKRTVTKDMKDKYGISGRVVKECLEYLCENGYIKGNGFTFKTKQ